MEEIGDVKYFSVLADEAADVSRIEQMSVVVCFMDNKSNRKSSCNLPNLAKGYLARPLQISSNRL